MYFEEEKMTGMTLAAAFAALIMIGFLFLEMLVKGADALRSRKLVVSIVLIVIGVVVCFLFLTGYFSV